MNAKGYKQGYYNSKTVQHQFYVNKNIEFDISFVCYKTFKL